MRAFILLLLWTSAIGCGRFNTTLTSETLVGVISNGGSFVKAYRIGTNSSLTLVHQFTVSGPTDVAVHPTDGTVFVISSGSSLQCWQLQYRSGATAATLSQSTTISGIQALSISPDGKFLYYGKSSSSGVFYRALNLCELGAEQSITGVDDPVTQIVFNSAGTKMYTVDSDATASGPHKYTRNTASGLPTFVASGPAAKLPLYLAPTETVLLARGSGANGSSFLESSMGLVTTRAGTPTGFHVSGTALTIYNGQVDGCTLNTSTGAFAGCVGVAFFSAGFNDANGGVANVNGTFFIGDQTASGIFANSATTSIGGSPSKVFSFTGYRN